MDEKWLDIPNYEGLYQISNLGRVKSIKNSIHFLQESDDGKGYKKIRLCKKGVLKSFRIHRLVAQCFIPNPDNKKEINHIDYDRSNNHVDNLEWCDREYNMNYSVKNNRFFHKPVKCIRNNKEFIFKSIKEASEKTGIDRTNIGRCCNKLRKKAGNCEWFFLKGEDIL